MLEDSNTIDEAPVSPPTTCDVATGVEANAEARRALADQTRRAPIQTGDEVLSVASGGGARRALGGSAVEPLPAPVTPPAAKAFVATRRPNKLRVRLVSAVSLVAVLGSISGMTLAKSAALTASEPISPASQTSVVRAVPVSRDLARPEFAAEFNSVSPSDAASTGVDETSAAPAEASAPATEPSPAETAAPAAPAPDPVLTTAPGQPSVASVEEAMARAAQMVGNMNYGNMCLSLVAAFYGYTSAGEVGAQQAAATAAAAGQLRTDMENIPVGALVWYDGTPVGNPYGHVAMYAGDGMVYSNGAANGGVGLIALTEPATGWGEPIIGWSPVWLPNATK